MDALGRYVKVMTLKMYCTKKLILMPFQTVIFLVSDFDIILKRVSETPDLSHSRFYLNVDVPQTLYLRTLSCFQSFVIQLVYFKYFQKVIETSAWHMYYLYYEKIQKKCGYYENEFRLKKCKKSLLCKLEMYFKLNILIEKTKHLTLTAFFFQNRCF